MVVRACRMRSRREECRHAGREEIEADTSVSRARLSAPPVTANSFRFFGLR